MRLVKTARRLAIMTVWSVILFVKPLLKLFVIAWAALVSKVYYKESHDYYRAGNNLDLAFQV